MSQETVYESIACTSAKVLYLEPFDVTEPRSSPKREPRTDRKKWQRTGVLGGRNESGWERWMESKVVGASELV